MTSKAHFRTSTAALLLAAAMVIPCSATAGPDISTEALPGTGSGTHITSTYTEAVKESSAIPVSREKNEINGRMTIIEVYEVPSTYDPDSLVHIPFGQDGYFYSPDQIVRSSYTAHDKTVEMEYRQSTDNADLDFNLKKMPYSMLYEKDGYVGELHLNPSTLKILPTEQETKSSTKREVKSYPMELNDPSQVPTLYNGLPLSKIDWEVTGYLEGASIPSGYNAVATYSRTRSWKEDSKWDVVASYSGYASKIDDVTYTVTYYGEEIPDGYIVSDGQLIKDPNAFNVAWVIVPLIIVLLGAAACLFLIWAFKRGLISSRRITVQAQDDMTGDYTVVQKVKVNKKSPSFVLDTLKMPAAKHYICEMSAKQAQVLRGKIITVTADGQVVTKHQVQPANDVDKYIFTVDLEVVEAGPADTFAL